MARRARRRLDDDARQKRATSPLRVFDVKSEQVREALQDAPKIGESLCEECAEHFTQVRALLDAYGVAYTSTRRSSAGSTTTRARRSSSSGPDESTQASTICGGGRYDYLVEEIGGDADAGHRLRRRHRAAVLSLELEGVTAAEPQLDVFFVVDDAAQRADVLTTMTELRGAGVSLRHRLRGPLAEGPADAGAEARGGRRDPDERRLDAAPPRRAGPAAARLLKELL